MIFRVQISFVIADYLLKNAFGQPGFPIYDLIITVQQLPHNGQCLVIKG